MVWSWWENSDWISESEMKESFVLLAGVVKPLREWLLWCFKEEEAMAWRRKNGEKERER
jgi:hypothetical protein